MTNVHCRGQTQMNKLDVLPTLSVDNKPNWRNRSAIVVGKFCKYAAAPIALLIAIAYFFYLLFSKFASANSRTLSSTSFNVPVSGVNDIISNEQMSGINTDRIITTMADTGINDVKVSQMLCTKSVSTHGSTIVPKHSIPIRCPRTLIVPAASRLNKNLRLKSINSVHNTSITWH